MATPSGWSVEQFLRMTRRWAVARGYLTAVPNFETATYNGTRVWGVYAIPPNPQLHWADVRGRADQGGLGIRALTPVPDAWRAGHRYATRFGYQTGLLTFEASSLPDGSPVFGLWHIKNSPLVWRDVPVGELETKPGFDKPDMVVRDINRWATRHGYAWGFPDFEARAGSYGAFLLPKGAGFAEWHDVPEAEIRGTTPPPSRRIVAAALSRQASTSFVWSGAPIATDPLTRRPITSVRWSCPSTWEVVSATLTHDGRTATVHQSIATDAFDGLTPAGTWSCTVTGTGLTEDACGLTIEVDPG